MRRIKKVVVHYEAGDTDEWNVEGNVRVHNTTTTVEDPVTGKKHDEPTRWLGIEAKVVTT